MTDRDPAECRCQSLTGHGIDCFMFDSWVEESAEESAEVPEPQGEPSDARLMARGGGRTQAMIDGLLAQANERGIRVEVIYPQGEPTDAQVQSALDAYFDTKAAPDWRGERTWRMRAALRAANDVATNHEIRRQGND